MAIVHVYMISVFAVECWGQIVKGWEESLASSKKWKTKAAEWEQGPAECGHHDQ